VDSSVTLGFPMLPSSRPQEEVAAACLPAHAVSHESGDSDEQLLRRICGHEQDALTSLFRRYARLVRVVAYRVLQDASEADDLLQDIFFLVHRLSGKFDPAKGTVRVWIMQMAYRRAISRRRYLTSRHFYNRVDLEDVAETLKDLRSETGRLETSLAGQLGAGNWEQAWETLSEAQRRTLWLHFFEGYSLTEIATQTGQSRGNIKHHYFRGLERLRKHVFGGTLEGGDVDRKSHATKESGRCLEPDPMTNT
jgi:RNA polymerase sigma-70 factor, ECF subfamily